jgi:DNA-directed RNA polymerase specialized sigma24 family protein
MEAVIERKKTRSNVSIRDMNRFFAPVILNVIRDEADVEDVLHDVMLQLWEQGHRCNSNEKGARTSGYLSTQTLLGSVSEAS